MYDLSVEGAENFVANGILAHNSGYPDCRPEYIEAFERMANLATKAGVEGTSRLRIHTPLISLTKGQIVRRGVELGVDFALTWSCYEPEPDGRACGLCDSCLLRRKGFAEAGLSDPVPAAH
jgi:7-cyano-7-deazaguanine synthase